MYKALGRCNTLTYMYTNRAKNKNFLFMHIYQYVELISPSADVRNETGDWKEIGLFEQV